LQSFVFENEVPQRQPGNPVHFLLVIDDQNLLEIRSRFRFDVIDELQGFLAVGHGDVLFDGLGVFGIMGGFGTQPPHCSTFSSNPLTTALNPCGKGDVGSKTTFIPMCCYEFDFFVTPAYSNLTAGAVRFFKFCSLHKVLWFIKF
jgi:hypothetical protein